MPMPDNKSLNGIPFNVSDVEISVSNGHISSVVFTDASAGKKIMLCPSVGVVTFGGISTPFSLSNGSVKIGRSGMTILWQPSK